jgi:hypothetical protein
MMNGIRSRLALWTCALALVAGCADSSSEPADAGAVRDSAPWDASTDTSVAPMVWCGSDGGTPCCSDDLVVSGSPGPRFLVNASVARITGTIGVGVLSAVEPAAADAPTDGPCVDGSVTGMLCEYRSTWTLAMASGATTRVDSSLEVADASWLVGQTVHLLGQPGSLLYFTMQLQDESGRLLVWQMNGEAPWDTDTFSAIESETSLPFTLSVHRAPEDAICRHRTEPCWTHDVQALDVTVDGVVHSLGPDESFEFVADGLRYRVTDRIIASRRGAGCYDRFREGWSLDVVALGPAT